MRTHERELHVSIWLMEKGGLELYSSFLRNTHTKKAGAEIKRSCRAEQSRRRGMRKMRFRGSCYFSFHFFQDFSTISVVADISLSSILSFFGRSIKIGNTPFLGLEMEAMWMKSYPTNNVESGWFPSSLKPCKIWQGSTWYYDILRLGAMRKIPKKHQEGKIAGPDMNHDTNDIQKTDVKMDGNGLRSLTTHGYQ